MRASRLCAVLGASVLLLSACKVDAALRVDVDDDGSGVVRARFVLDREAVETLGGNLDDALHVADLIQVGWQVEVDDDVDGDEGGGAEAVAVKEFGSPEELTEVVAELSGGAGPFREFRLARDRSFFSTDFEFAGRVDLEGGVGATALDPDDEGLALELQDEGVEVDELQAFLSERLADVFTVEVVVALPGDGSTNAPGRVGGEPRWEPPVGEAVELRVQSSSLDLDRILWLVLAALLLLLAAGVYTGRVVLPRRGDTAAEPASEAREGSD